MRSASAVLLVLAGCHELFSLERIDEGAGSGDGGTGDGDVDRDAALACPASGPPVFSGIVRQWSTRGCWNYTISANGRAAAECYDTNRIEVGDVEGDLAPQPGLPTVPAFESPRLSPEGDELILVDSSNDIVIFRDVGGVWSNEGTIPRPQAIAFEPSTPSSVGDRRILMHDMQRVFEYGSQGGNWLQLRVMTVAELRVSEVKGPVSLSPDAKRFVFYATGPQGAGAYYSERTSVDTKFGIAARLEGVPTPSYADPFMTSDCGRVYYNDDNAMFVVSQ